MSSGVQRKTATAQVALMGKNARADVTCITQPTGALKCSVSDDQLERIRERIAPGSFKHLIEGRRITADERTKRRGSRIWNGLWAGFKHLPISKLNLYSRIARGMITADNIVATVEGNSGATRNNHNDIRNEYMASKLNPKSARELGIVAKRIPFLERCPKGYDWADSKFYNNVSSCKDVVDEMRRDDLAVVMFASKVPWRSAQSLLGDPTISPFYSRYANSGPIPCTTDTAIHSAYHSLKVFGSINVDFIMKSMVGEGYLAWEMKKSCETIDGEKRTPPDLMFNFGQHIFETLRVEIDGKMEERTLIFSSVAAASTSIFKVFIPKRVPYYRFVGGSLAKMLLLEAKYNNWKIEKQ